MFQGVGGAKVDRVQIQTEAGHTLVQQKRRPIVLNYKDMLNKHLDKLKTTVVVSGSLGSKWATRWIYNVVIMEKRYTKKKKKVTLDTHLLAKLVKTLHFSILTPQELRHQFAGLNRFSRADLNHAFHHKLP